MGFFNEMFFLLFVGKSDIDQYSSVVLHGPIVGDGPLDRCQNWSWSRIWSDCWLGINDPE
jgi:hypothetical protein